MCRDELDLEQLLADPLTRLVMSSDAVEETHIRQLASQVGARLRAAEQQSFANSYQRQRRAAC